MNAEDFEGHIAPAVASVLESMFFSEADGTSEVWLDPSDLLAEVSFSGEVSGTLAVRLSNSSARVLGASFLGVDEESLSETQMAEVVCELANMLCGWIVSRAKWQGTWELGSPELLPATAEDAEGIKRSFGVEQGILTISLSLSVNA